MKKNALPGIAVNVFCLICALSFPILLRAQTEKTRTVEKSFDGKTALWASHRYGDLIVKKGSDNQIKAVLKITATSKKEEELQAFLDRFDLQASEAPDNKVDIKTSAEIQNWKSVNGRTTIKFKDGKSFSGIQKFSMTLELYVPKLRYATLENKYDAIKVDEGVSEILEINLYDGKVEAPGTYEKLLLDMKYSDGRIGNFNQCDAKFYDSDLVLGDGKNLTMESKYSGLRIGNLQTLKLDAYDDDFKIGAVSGTVEIKDKYSEFTFNGNIGDAVLDLYDSQLSAKNGANIRVIDSKYTEYVFQELLSLHFNSSYDDNVRLEKTGTLSADQSKYTEYEVSGLWKTLRFPASYDDVIQVRQVGGTFEGLAFEGKYTDLTVPIPASILYEIDAMLKYGKIQYPENNMETRVYKEKNEEITLQGRMKGAAANAPKVQVKSFDGVIKLN